MLTFTGKTYKGKWVQGLSYQYDERTGKEYIISQDKSTRIRPKTIEVTFSNDNYYIFARDKSHRYHTSLFTSNTSIMIKRLEHK
jgi:hypothetical protein